MMQQPQGNLSESTSISTELPITAPPRWEIKPLKYWVSIHASTLPEKSLPVLMPNEHVNPAYLGYLLQTAAFTDRLIAHTIENSSAIVTETMLGSLHVAMPPLPEQAAIVAYLDHIESAIHTYIQKKQDLITLLAEQKRASIDHAVNHGLDPAVSLKPSGIQWVSDVPSHWTITPIRRLVTDSMLGMRGGAESTSGDLFIDSSNLDESMALDLTTVRYVKTPEDEQRTLTILDDILVCIAGARLGTVVHISDAVPSVMISQDIVLLRPSPTLIVPRFLAYVLRSAMGQHQFELKAVSDSKQGLTLRDVEDVLIAVPPYVEQQNIVSYLDTQIDQIDSAIRKTGRQIGLIEAYQARLIADVVSGNIDARKLVATLPTVSDESIIAD